MAETIIYVPGKLIAGEYGTKLANVSDLDNDVYGPYASVSAAHSALSAKGMNTVGTTVGISGSNNTVVEYWYQGGTAQANLVEKQQGGGGGSEQIQSDWNQTDSTKKDFIKNKPNIPDTSDYYTKSQSDNKYQPKGNYQPAGDYATKTELNGKVDKVSGKGLSTNDYTNAEKQKVADALVPADIAGKANASDVYTKSETYTKTEVNGLVDTPHQEYVTVDVYSNLPATGSKDTIYRVSNYNGSTSQVDASVYSEYAWNGTQYIFLCVKSQIGEVFDVSVYNNNAKYANLAAALNGGANIPQSLQKGGMSVKFVHSSDNKYVQYRLMKNTWSTTESDWQGVDEEPTRNSRNTVESGGAQAYINRVIGSEEKGLNLDKSNLVYKQYYLVEDNELHDGDYNLLTEFYKVEVGDCLQCSIGIGGATKYSIIAFDENKNIIPLKSKANNWYSPYTVDEGVSYLRFCVSSSTGNINGFYVRQIPIQSNICLAFSRDTLNFNNTNHRIELSYEFYIKVGGKYYNIPSGNVNYNWIALSSSLICLYYDYDNSLLKFGYYSDRIKYPILASFYGTGTTNETNVVNAVQACCCRFMIDGIPQDTELIHGVFNDYYSPKNDYTEATPAFELLTQNVLSGGGIFNFDLIPTAHSSSDDQYEINLPANTEIKGIIHLTDAELENGYALNAYLIDENQTRLKTLSGLQVDVPFVISATSDAKYLAFYIYKITKKGRANVAWYYNDKSIQNQVNQLANNIPSYFEENVKDVIEKGRVDIANAGVDGDNMIFITDIHWEENTRNSPIIVRHICDNLTVGSVVMGGDVVNGQADQDTARKLFCDVANGLRSPKSRLVSVFGNHDMNANDGGTSFGDFKSFYAYFQKPLDYLAKDVNNECYFYFDNETTNTRYIVLNSKGPGGYELGTAQATWFENLLDTTPSTMHIVVFIHALIKSQKVEGGTYDGYWEILPNVPGQTAITIIDDAIDAGKKVEYIITGHYHQDYNGVTSKGVPIIMTDCDGKDTIFRGRTAGTVTEQCFDLMTMNYSDNLISCRRVGRGKSRIVHRGVNSVSVGQTLNISNLISITPSSYTAMDEWGYRYLTPTDTGGPQKAYVHNFGSINSSGVFTAAAAGIGLVWAENDDIVEYFTIKVV